MSFGFVADGFVWESSCKSSSQVTAVVEAHEIAGPLLQSTIVCRL